MHSDFNHAATLERIVLKNEFFGVRCRVPVARIAGRVGDDSAAKDTVVKRVMDVTVNPQVSLWQELAQIANKRGIDGLPGVTKVDRERVWAVMADDHCFAVVAVVQLLFEPCP